MPQGSPSFELDATDLRKIGKGAVIAASGAALPALAQYFGTVEPATAIGGILAGIGGVLVNAARKWLADNR